MRKRTIGARIFPTDRLSLYGPHISRQRALEMWAHSPCYFGFVLPDESGLAGSSSLVTWTLAWSREQSVVDLNLSWLALDEMRSVTCRGLGCARDE